MPSLSRNILTLLQLSCTASTAHPHCWACKPPSKNASCTQETTVLVHHVLPNCLHHKAPWYCIPISDVASRRHLYSVRRHYLVVPRHSLSSYGRRAFVVVGPTAWNSLSDDLCCLLYTSPSPRDRQKSRMPPSA